MKDQIASVGIAAAQALAPVFILLLGLVAKRLHDLISTKVNNERLAGILSRLNDTAWIAINQVANTMASKLDPANPAKGLEDAKAAALDVLKTHLGQRGLDEIKSVLGLNGADLEKVLVSYIEARVHVVNNQRSITPTPLLGGAQ
jgi:hypothetical protein